MTSRTIFCLLFTCMVTALNAQQPHRPTKVEMGLFCGTPPLDEQRAFTYSLFRQLNSENENLFFSPYSISTALGMTYEGARGRTAEEMKNVLHLNADSVKRRANAKSLFTEINRENLPYKLSTANALWAASDFVMRPSFKSTIANYYGGGVTNLDFVHQSEASRKTINSWVEERTNNRIKNLIPSGAITPLTRLVLTNAIYFKGAWLKQFNKDDTRESAFTTSTGATQQVKMMAKTDEKAVYNYYADHTFQMIELPYAGNDLSMIVLLPKQDKMKYLTTPDFLNQISQLELQMKQQRVNVFLPKFKFDTKYMLSSTLSKMGMPTAFDDGANFSGMSANESLKISEVIHQAFVEVNEEGTEAAAATAVVMVVTDCIHSTRDEIPEFRADHPFLFLIKQKSTGEVLFMGRMNKVS